MAKRRTTRRGGAWYNPFTWFSSAAEEPVPTGQSSPIASPPVVAAPTTSYGGKKHKTRRGGRKHRRGSKSARIYGY